MLALIVTAAVFLSPSALGLEVSAKTIALPEVEEFSLSSREVVVFDLTDGFTEMYAEEAAAEAEIASLTKIMTAIVVLENREMDEEVTVTREMVSNLGGYVTAGLKVGEKYTVKDLMYALLLPSAGDAAQALAIDTAGSILEFVEMMNQKAEELGVLARFSNPVGMDRADFLELWGKDEEVYASAEAVATILKTALEKQEFREIFGTDKYTMADGTKLTKTTAETAKEYGLDISVLTGAKTGYTVGAGRCLASIAKLKNGAEFLVVNLGAKMPYHLIDAVKIYDYFDENYEYKTVLSEGDEVARMEVIDAKQKEYIVRAPEELRALMRKDKETSELTVMFTGEGMAIDRSMEVGRGLGTIVVKRGEEVIYQVGVTLDEEIEYHNYIIYMAIGLTGAGIAGLIWFGACKKIRGSV